MKKNLLSILILALLVVNLVLTAVMMVTTISANQKVSSLVGNIASAIDLELTPASEDGELTPQVPMEDVATHEINDMTIPLTIAESVEGEKQPKEHFVVVSLTLSMNMKDKDYKTYGETIADRTGLIQSVMNDVISVRTIDEMRDLEVRNEIQQEILEQVQNMFGSSFIYKVSFKNIVYQ